MAKALALRERIAQIHPACEVHAVEAFVEADNWPALLQGRRVDGVIDACDQVRAKQAIAAWSLAARVPVVCAGAAGGKRAAQRVEVADLADVTHDPLLAALRQRLRKAGAAARSGAIGLRCVFSREAVVRPDAAACDADAPPHRRQPQLPRLWLERGGDRHLRHGGRGRADAMHRVQAEKRADARC